MLTNNLFGTQGTGVIVGVAPGVVIGLPGAGNLISGNQTG